MRDPSAFGGVQPFVNSTEPAYVVGDDRPAEAFELDLADRVGVDDLLDVRKHSLADQDLSWLRVGAEPGREVRDGPERAVVVAAFKADPTERRVAGGDADPQPEVGAALPPGIGELIEPRL